MASVNEALFKPAQYIQKIFKDAGDPSDAIEIIQKDNKIKVPSVQAALSLLDLHGISREEIHQSLFTSLENDLCSRLEALDAKGIRRLLDKAFQYTSVPEMCRVVMKMLETISVPIDEKYVK
jgi:negative elongation factor B